MPWGCETKNLSPLFCIFDFNLPSLSPSSFLSSLSFQEEEHRRLVEERKRQEEAARREAEKEALEAARQKAAQSVKQ